MTVVELIAKLSELDPATEVVSLDDQGYSFGLQLYSAEMGGLKNRFTAEEEETITDDPDHYPTGQNIPHIVERKFKAVVVTTASDCDRSWKNWEKL